MGSPQVVAYPLSVELRGAWRARAADLPPLAYLCAALALLWASGERYVLPRLQDDAYYYLVIARNIFETGRSEFTPGVLTNGYHPLWMLALVAAGSVFGFTVTMLKALEMLAVFAGFAIVVRLFRVTGLAASLCVTASLWFAVSTFALNGMETSLLFPGFAWFVAACLAERERREVPLLLASLWCLGTRLDAALVVLPMLCAVDVGRAAKLRIAGVLAAFALLYLGVSHAVFGSALPVSGAVKSLGGLQWNVAYFAQLARELRPEYLFPLRSAAMPYLAALALLAFALLRPLPPRVAGVIYAACAGVALYGAKLALGSSWVVWPWYAFPWLVPLLIAIWIAARVTPSKRSVRVVQAVIGVSVACLQLRSELEHRSEGFAAVSRAFIDQHASLLAGRTVAMGDRAGSFAHHYRGGVYQLEGLVNGADYLEILKAGGELRPHLCGRGVSVLVAFDESSPSAGARPIPVYQPGLTTRAGPYVTVTSADELASFEDQADFRGHNPRIRAWDLGCPSRAASTPVAQSTDFVRMPPQHARYDDELDRDQSHHGRRR